MARRDHLLDLALKRGLQSMPPVPAVVDEDKPSINEEEIRKIVDERVSKLLRIHKPSDGADGVGIVKVWREGNQLLQELTTGEVIAVGDVFDGVDGVGVSTIERVGDELLVMLSNGELITAGNVFDGQSIQGEPGVSVVGIQLTRDKFVFHLSDMTVINVSIMPVLEALQGMQPEQEEFLKIRDIGIEQGHLVVTDLDGNKISKGKIPSRQGGGTSRTSAVGASKREITVTVTSDYTATGTEDVIFVDALAAEVTITLPSAVGREKPIFVKRINPSGSNVRVEPQTGEKIENKDFRIINVPNYTLRLSSDKSNWWET